MQLYENEPTAERAVLVAVDYGDHDVTQSLEELGELARTAQAEVLAVVTQNRQSPDNATYAGSGKLEEIKNLCANLEANLVICDDELSPVQLRNLEDGLDVRVIDRTMLILDIFAARARSAEGKLQVELAQLKYSMPRLTGKGKSLSRQGGGIGTRGPGESQLESDKRQLRVRITRLQHDLDELQKRRAAQRIRRKKNGIESVAIVGYTNAGKSTLMNALTQAGVLAEDKLFATLDPTARALKLPDGRTVMLVDTVGFVQRLPHHLVQAFHSTLEEATDASLILSVCDISNSDCQHQMQVTAKLLSSLGCDEANIPVLQVLNKCDLVSSDILSLPVLANNVRVSALNGDGLDDLLKKIAALLSPNRAKVQLLLPYAAQHAAVRFREEGTVITEDFREDGIFYEVVLPIWQIEPLRAFLI
ncbi:MAG: GTPase HflX [Oscillospiraceae bacterium]|jgi:GTP-binding protein HflX|nr:GTPase HflX [Oscillospiraceae bacterium]